eukprot:CAMPEP_0205903794 /NCGR_PEP_ID=MMETSP1325-20131115/323_1 /ASSEMBLY_ACC=CAM_ASM_000708 /TAXON_ID=236786 /ORGANISM="Florenciella sp., Strain RCC1007" /LENGTH=146 /DNA_ID=CAMNT_0053269483 /DNA_START=345 /DNA_END=782 /DNA_ORIENTATION=+
MPEASNVLAAGARRLGETSKRVRDTGSASERRSTVDLALQVCREKGTAGLAADLVEMDAAPLVSKIAASMLAASLSAYAIHRQWLAAQAGTATILEWLQNLGPAVMLQPPGMQPVLAATIIERLEARLQRPLHESTESQIKRNLVE